MYRLEHFLNEETRTLLVISHDQAFLTAVVEETIVLRNQTLKYFEGTPAAFEVEEKKEAKRLIGQKEALDKKFGPSWHAVVGEGFGFNITFNAHHMLYTYYGEKLGILIFKC
ncbi:MAG: hypothetical protein EOO65_04140 [Methanosarcinales archaeon]|nr:MAG: hypothetical protein EOO65_04140 [Methanosarcinales archaeon]